MILLLDMDSVTADLMKAWLSKYNTDFNDDLTIDEILTWDSDRYIKPECSKAQYYGYIHEPDFFANLDVFPNAIEVTRRLQERGHTLYFLTATPYDSRTGSFDKRKWVERLFPHIGQKGVIETHHKYMVKGDLLFDDSPTNLETFPGIKVVMDYNYNKNVNVNYRVTNWLEFEQVVIRIEELQKALKVNG